MAKGGTHEDLSRAAGPVPVGSERSFGLVFAVVFTIIALLPLKDGESVRLWALGVAGVFLVAALAVPKILRPLNLVWFRFGMLLHHIVTPLVMGLLFFVTVTPIGVLMRLCGKDPLRLKRNDAASYWIARTPPGPAPETMKQQF
jgi:hypothetical protein